MSSSFYCQSSTEKVFNNDNEYIEDEDGIRVVS
jgi:hypothetical protein